MPSRTKLPTDWHFARPELARHYLNAFEIGLVSGIALYARRHGKTELLTQDLQPAALAQGYAVGYCNLWQEDEDPAQALAEAVCVGHAQDRSSQADGEVAHASDEI